MKRLLFSISFFCFCFITPVLSLEGDNNNNTTEMLKSLQSFIKVDENLVQFKKKIEKEKVYVAPSITEFLPLLSEKRQIEYIVLSPNEEKFIHKQVLNTLNLNEKGTKAKMKILLSFFRLYTSVGNTIDQKLKGNAGLNLAESNFQNIIETIEKSNGLYTDKDKKNWSVVINHLGELSKDKSKDYSSLLIKKVKEGKNAEAIQLCDKWSKFLLTNFSDTSFAHLREPILNHLQEIQLTKYFLWQKEIQKVSRVLGATIDNSKTVQDKSKRLGNSVRLITQNSRQNKVDKNIPEWQKGAQELQKFEKIRGELNKMNYQFNTWFKSFESTNKTLKNSSQKFVDLSLKGVQIRKDIDFIEEIKKEYWEAKLNFLNSKKTREWLDYLTSSAVETLQYKELSKQKEKNQILTIIIAAVIILVAALAIYVMFNKNRQISRSKQALEESNEENTRINNQLYEALDTGKKVQEMIVFPTYDKLSGVFPGIEIAVNQAYQTIIGDFYWSKVISGNKKIFCLVDCESHGSGAALYAVAIKQVLDKLLIEGQGASTSQIFMYKFVKELETNYKENSVIRDSQLRFARINLIWIDENNSELTYISDYTSLFILKQDGRVVEIKKTMNPGLEDVLIKKEPIEEGDILFAYSNGVRDQTIYIESDKYEEGYTEKRLGSRRLANILKEVNNKRINRGIADLSNEFTYELSRYDIAYSVDDEVAMFIPLS